MNSMTNDNGTSYEFQEATLIVKKIGNTNASGTLLTG
jgi:hypothetical protein